MTDEAADPHRGASGYGETDRPPHRDQEPDPHGQNPGPTGPVGPAGTGPTGWAPGGQGYAPSGPPPGSASFTSRYGLVRPQQGRYLAGVCAAIGRATNTDPILWRVLLAVLGFFGGIGIVVYVAAWLIIPAEGDSASPVESMLGRGRSSMSPVLVIILGILVTVLFGYIVTDVSRAILLGAAILIGGALLLNRNATGSPGRMGPVPPSGPPGPTTSTPPSPGSMTPVPPTGPGAYPPPPEASAATTVPINPAVAGQPAANVPGPEGMADPDRTPAYPQWPSPAATTPPSAGPLGEAYPAQQGPAFGPGYPGDPLTQPVPPSPAPPVAGGGPVQETGYRPPFAPHGPYASAGPRPPHMAPPVRTQERPKPPKPPRERSSLGAATFSLIFVAIGVVVILDLLNAVPGRPSTYFAAVLITIALGLLVGTWFGRARWLIFLGLVAAAALGISTLAESYEVDQEHRPVVWRPASHDALATRYQTRFSDAVLDLRQVDFTGRDTEVTVRVNFGKLRVIVPPNVDTTVTAQVDAGAVQIFDTHSSGVGQRPREVTDLGADGAGGGTLRLILQVTGGDAEVSR